MDPVQFRSLHFPPILGAMQLVCILNSLEKCCTLYIAWKEKAIQNHPKGNWSRASSNVKQKIDPESGPSSQGDEPAGERGIEFNYMELMGSWRVSCGHVSMDMCLEKGSAFSGIGTEKF